MLHNKTRFLKEEAARIFYRCLATIATVQPKLCLLENVCGMLRVWDKVGCT